MCCSTAANKKMDKTAISEVDAKRFSDTKNNRFMFSLELTDPHKGFLGNKL